MLLDVPRPQALGSLPPGEAGTRATLRLMRGLVQQYKSGDRVRRTALELTADLPPKDRVSEVRSLFDFVRDRVRYVRDVLGVETLQTPDATLDLLAGDCDDKSILLASLLESIGHPTRFVAVGYSAPGEFQHVYTQALVGNQWVSLDATMQHAAGWAPRPSVSRMIVSN